MYLCTTIAACPQAPKPVQPTRREFDDPASPPTPLPCSMSRSGMAGAMRASLNARAVLDMNIAAELDFFGDHLDVASDSYARLDLTQVHRSPLPEAWLAAAASIRACLPLEKSPLRSNARERRFGGASPQAE